MAESDPFSEVYPSMGLGEMSAFDPTTGLGPEFQVVDPQFMNHLPGSAHVAGGLGNTGVTAPLISAEFQTSLDNKRTKNRLAQRKHRSEVRQRQQKQQQQQLEQQQQQQQQQRQVHHGGISAHLESPKSSRTARDSLDATSSSSSHAENNPTDHARVAWRRDSQAGTRPMSRGNLYAAISPTELAQSEFPFSQLPVLAPSDTSEFPSPEDFIFSPHVTRAHVHPSHGRNRSISANPGEMNETDNAEASASSPPSPGASEHDSNNNNNNNNNTTKRRRLSLLPDPPPSATNNTRSIESRIMHVLNAVEEMGFENFDAAVTAYYTAAFASGSLPHYAQSTSRSRRLRQFLADLHHSAQSWVGREAQGYHDERAAATEQHRTYEEEMARLVLSGTRGTEAEVRKRRFIADMVEGLLQDETTGVLFRRDRQFLREQLPEIWSLLSKVARQTNSEEVDVSQAICVFLYMLRVFK